MLSDLQVTPDHNLKIQNIKNPKPYECQVENCTLDVQCHI